jgi:hypothetical protein
VRTVQGIEVVTQQPIDVMTGVLATSGGLQIAMRVQPGLDGTIILPPNDAAELVINLKDALTMKLEEN